MRTSIFRDLNQPKVRANVFSLFSEKGINFLLNFTIGIYFIHYLGPERFGKWSYALNMVLLVMPFAELGYATIVIRELVANPQKKGTILGSGLLLNLIGALCVYGLLASFAYVQFSSDVFMLTLILGTSLLMLVPQVIDAYFQSEVLAKYNVLGRSLANIFTSFIRLALIIFGFQLIWFAANYILNIALSMLLLAWLYQRGSGNTFRSWKVDSRMLKTIGFSSALLVFKNGLNLINFKIDQFFIEYSLGFSSLGIYAAAAQYSELWVFFPNAVFSSLFPGVVKEFHEKKDITPKIIAYNGLFFYFGLAICVGILLFSDWLIPWLLGEAFRDSVLIIQIHACSLPFLCMGIPAAKVMIIKGRIREMVVIKFIGAILNVFLNLLFIPHFGLVGAAVTTIISYAFSFSFGCLIFSSTRELFFQQMQGLRYPWVALRRRY